MKSLRLLSFHKWAQKLRFSELGRNEWGYAGIEGSGERRVAGIRRKNFTGCKNSQPLRNLAFNLLKNCFPLENNSCKKNTKIMNKSTEK